MRIKLTPRKLMIGLLVLIAGIVVLVTRLGGTSSPGNALTVSPAASSSAEPSEPPPPSSDDGVNPAPAKTTTAAAPKPTGTPGEDGTDPILIDPTNEPDVHEAAVGFAAAWLNAFGKTPGQWRADLTPRVTASVAEDLGYADPDSVPAAAKAAEPVDIATEGSLFTAVVPVVTTDARPKPLGELHLTLVHQGGKWLVSEIDWQAARP